MRLPVLLLSLLALSPSSWAAPGQVLVEVKIESAKFRNGLGAAIAATEQVIATKLAGHLEEMFPPFEWMTSAPADGAAATLTATLAQDADALPNIVLRWSTKIAKDVLLLHKVRELPVYESNDPRRPYRNASELAAQLDGKIRQWLNSDSTETHLHDEFIRRIPLATKVEFDETARAVLIPLTWSTAMMSDESQFRLEFMRPLPQHQMKVLINGVAERLSGAMRGKTQGIVAQCFASNQAVQTDIWNMCVAVLAQQDAPPLLVSFERYKFAGLVSGVSASGTSVTP